MKFVEKFGVLLDLGIVVVSPNYQNAGMLADFRRNNEFRFAEYDYNINDANFGNPTRILQPSDRLWVRVHRQVVSGTTTTEERMTHLSSLQSYYTGAQGAATVFEQRRTKLPKRGSLYASFDVGVRLCKDAEDYRVPGVFVGLSGEYHFRLGHFSKVWHETDYFFSYCDPPPM